MNEDQFLDSQFEDQFDSEPQEPDAGWPGDGSGMDDLADFNANEAADYADEGADYDTPMAEDFGGE